MRRTIAGSLFSGLLFAAGAAQAVPMFPEFTVTPGAAYQGSAGSSFVANKITGTYDETVTFNLDGTFNVSILWVAGQFVNVPVVGASTTYSAGQSGLGVNYNLYALFQGNGTYVLGPTSTFTLTPGSGLGLTVYFDSTVGGDTASTFANPVNGSALYGVTPGAGTPDSKLADGTTIIGNGNLSCTDAGKNCGSFGQTTTFPLTAAGSAFFTFPIPFYDLSFQNGQFNGFTPVAGQTQQLNGSLDATFGNVPEPATIALVGLALVGLGLSRRGRKV